MLKYRIVLYPKRSKPTFCQWHDFNATELEGRTLFYVNAGIPIIAEFRIDDAVTR